MKREHQPKPKKRRLPRTPVPPPSEVMRDRRRRRPGEEIRREIEEQLEELDEILDDNQRRMK